MLKHTRTGAIGALLDEYEKSINELKHTIDQIPDNKLPVIIDNITRDPYCKSYQGILAHIVSAGFNYAIAIKNYKGQSLAYTDKILLNTIIDYKNELDNVFNYTVETFEQIDNNEMEEYEDDKKIKVRWGQSYDIEQLFEHAIVHILRHRRQIEKFMAIDAK